MKKVRTKCLREPHGNKYVWRYMSESKFERLLKESALYFCNAKHLSDKYEVTIPDSTVVNWRRELGQRGYEVNDIENEIQTRLASWQCGALADLTMINCWTARKYESYALWKIYLSGGQDGVAIRTKYSRIEEAIAKGNDPFSEDYYAGTVNYKNHLTPEEAQNRFNLITTKKTFYDFEEEVRLFIVGHPNSEGGNDVPYDASQGRTVKIKLSSLLSNVFLSPFASDSYRKDLPRILKQYQLDPAVIRNSEILDK
jgi:hypothetical protein